MKEITRTFNVQITQVVNLEDSVVDEVVEDARNGKSKRLLEGWFKDEFRADDANVSDIRVFVRDEEADE